MLGVFFVVVFLGFFWWWYFTLFSRSGCIHLVTESKCDPCDNGCIILSSFVKRMYFVHRFSYLLIQGQKITDRQNPHMKDAILVIKGKLPIKVCYKWFHSK